MPLTIYNTLSRQKEVFKPLREGVVGMYVCGPTVYGHSHIGHAKSYVSFDVIVRYLRFIGYTVTYVQNITDVGHLLGDTNEGEDRLLRQGRLEHKHPMEIAELYTRSYFEDMDALEVKRPDISPRATGHIIEQIEIVKALLQKGYAYEVNGSVYFDVSKDKNYGKLSGRSTEESESGTRIEVKSEKKHPNDFALWKFAEPEHIMRWPSPWGVGFPGWHVECSAMSMKYLGDSFDIHGGGMDNQFPHHECEIAQSECATGKPFVRYWIHNNLVTVNGQKMSKSLGNVILLKDAFKQYSPLVVRFFILQSHYRSTLDFTPDALGGAAKGLEKLHNAARNVRLELKKTEQGASPSNGGIIDIAGYRNSMMSAMDDDFNTAQVIALLFDFSRDVNTLIAGGGVSHGILQQINQIYSEIGGKVIGIIPDDIEVAGAASGGDEAGLVDFLLELRAEVRQQKLWSLSDKIRDGLGKLGIVVEDKKEGSSWRRIR
ncbi:MAG TPA: cysteine--tRNA ligase [Bacteroidota bacterium]|nr:cysteine--tRNA ligase [Bacteroidota bacterium]